MTKNPTCLEKGAHSVGMRKSINLSQLFQNKFNFQAQLKKVKIRLFPSSHHLHECSLYFCLSDCKNANLSIIHWADNHTQTNIYPFISKRANFKQYQTILYFVIDSNGFKSRIMIFNFSAFQLKTFSRPSLPFRFCFFQFSYTFFRRDKFILRTASVQTSSRRSKRKCIIYGSL